MFEGLPQPFQSNKSVNETNRAGAGPVKKSPKTSGKKKTNARGTNTPKAKSKARSTSSLRNNFNHQNSITKSAKSKTGPKDDIEKSFEIDYKLYDMEHFESDDNDDDRIISSPTSSSPSSSTASLNELNPEFNRKNRASDSDELYTKSIQSIHLDSGSMHNLLVVDGQSTAREQNSAAENEKAAIQQIKDKFFAIYERFDNLIKVQERNTHREPDETQLDQINGQKADFLNEIEKELDENIKFSQISSDPEMIKQLKEIHDRIQKSKQPVDDEDTEPRQVSSLSKRTNSRQGSERAENSIKSGADIREIYELIESFGQRNSVKHNDNNNDIDRYTPEMTIYPTRRNSQSKKSYKIPVSLSNKINTLLVSTFQQDQPIEDDINEESLKNYTVSIILILILI